MLALAVVITGASFADPAANVQVWGSAAAAVVAAIVVLTGAGPVIGWLAVGYIGFAAFRGDGVMLLLLALAAAFVPLLPRPRGSVAIGLGVAIATALALHFVPIGPAPAG